MATVVEAPNQVRRFWVLLLLAMAMASSSAFGSVEVSNRNPNPNPNPNHDTESRIHGVSLRQSQSKRTVQEQLLQHGLPVGLLPETVVSYDLDRQQVAVAEPEERKFEVRLRGACRFVIPGDKPYPVAYESSISGTISRGSIKDLRGVSVRAMFKWWPITAIRSSSDGRQITFQVGPVSASYPAANFGDVPACEAGAAARAA